MLFILWSTLFKIPFIKLLFLLRRFSNAFFNSRVLISFSPYLNSNFKKILSYVLKNIWNKFSFAVFGLPRILIMLFQFDLVHVWITLFVFSVEGFINKLYPIFWFTYLICAKHKSNWKMIWNISFYYTRPGLNATYYSVWWPIAKKNEIKNENKKNEKIKNILFRKKTPQIYHGLWVPNLKIFLFKK